jgi:hypothetical protein
MPILSIRFKIVDAPHGSVVRGPAVYEDGKRVGRLVCEVADDYDIFKSLPIEVEDVRSNNREPSSEVGSE